MIQKIDPSNGDQQQSNLLKFLKQKCVQLTPLYQKTKNQKTHLMKKLRQTLQKKQFFMNQKVVQQKKYKSLNLLVNQLQSSLQKETIESKSKQIIISQEQESKSLLQNYVLREELIKINEICKEDQKMFTLLKNIQNNQTNIKNFIAKSDYIQNQAEILAQLRSHLKNLQNPNLQCRRKWVALQKQKKKNQKNLKLYKIQIDRQASLLKSLYQDYLQKVNISKSKIVNFNQTQRQKVLTDFLVGQVSVIQQKRRQVEDENRNLHFHFKQLSQQLEKVQLQNRQLNSFFLNENRTQESKLAMKMKTRIQQLRDSLAQVQNRNSIVSIANKRSFNLEYLRKKLAKVKQANDYLEIKIKNVNSGNFSHMNETDISDFFTVILNSKDQKIRMSKERSNSINEQLRQLTIKQLLLTNQLSTMEEALKQNNIQHQFIKRQNFNKNS